MMTQGTLIQVCTMGGYLGLWLLKARAEKDGDIRTSTISMNGCLLFYSHTADFWPTRIAINRRHFRSACASERRDETINREGRLDGQCSAPRMDSQACEQWKTDIYWFVGVVPSGWVIVAYPSSLAVAQKK